MAEPPTRHRAVAGWPLTAVLGTLALIALGCWMIWATRTLVEVRSRRIVSVSLSGMIRDFVSAEARAGRPSEDAAVRSRTYLAAVDRAVTELGRNGDVVIVSEATLGRSVPDRTPEVRARVAQAMEAADARR